MKDIEYAGLAQLSYLHWHKLSKVTLESVGDNTIKNIISKEITFSKLKNSDYEDMATDGKDYYVKKDSKGRKIYSGKDARLMMLYSEDPTNAEKKPKFAKDFEGWKFVKGYDHHSIYDALPVISTSGKPLYVSSVYEKSNKVDIKKISKEDSGFAASIFSKGNNVVIAYRGTDENLKDMSGANTNFLRSNYIKDQFVCAYEVYKKVLVSSKGKTIHLTGHSLGGALAWFVFVCSKGAHPTVRWNGYALDRKMKGNDYCKDLENLYNQSFQYLEKERKDLSKNMTSYFISTDMVGTRDQEGEENKTQSINFIIGKSVPVDNRLTRRTYTGAAHSIFNFLPFMNDNGMLVKGKNGTCILNENYIRNTLKDAYRNCKKVPSDDTNLISMPEFKTKNPIEKNKKLLSYILDTIELYDYTQSIYFDIFREHLTKEVEGTWYDKDKLEIGKFNNLAFIAGVSGGIPEKMVDYIPKQKGYTSYVLGENKLEIIKSKNV